MTTAFIGILLGVLTVSIVGILSARAAKRHDARKAAPIRTTQQTTSERNASQGTPNAMELAAVGTGQGNGSVRDKRDRMSSSGTI